jgi:hypothetical protein
MERSGEVTREEITRDLRRSRGEEITREEITRRRGLKRSEEITREEVSRDVKRSRVKRSREM